MTFAAVGIPAPPLLPFLWALLVSLVFSTVGGAGSIHGLCYCLHRRITEKCPRDG
jgi:hypothetical protein